MQASLIMESSKKRRHKAPKIFIMLKNPKLRRPWRTSDANIWLKYTKTSKIFQDLGKRSPSTPRCYQAESGKEL